MREQRRLAAIVPVNFSAKSVVGHSRPGRVSSKPGDVRYAADSGSKLSIRGSVIGVNAGSIMLIE